MRAPKNEERSRPLRMVRVAANGLFVSTASVVRARKSASSSGMPAYGFVNRSSRLLYSCRNRESASDGWGTSCGSEHACDECRGAVANHAANGFFREWGGAALLEELIRRLGEVTPRIHQRSVEIKDDQTEL